MADPVLLLFDDGPARGWIPFATTRPVGELLFGTRLLRERTEKALRLECRGHLGADELAGFTEEGAPPVLAGGEAPEGRRVLVLSRAVLEKGAELPEEGSATLTVEGRVAGWIVEAGRPLPGPESLAAPDDAGGDGATVELDGRILESPWQLMTGNAERVARDLTGARDESFMLGDVHVLGARAVSLGEHAAVEPGVVMDVRDGPVRLEAGVTVQAPARLTGPLWIGRDSTVLGGPVGTSSVGPVCKVRGELADSVVNGYCNKAHDGHLGHAVLGRWVNLGAGTTNSDLKNSYSPVRLRLPGGDVDTGLLKVGCFLGDHVKTGIGTLLNTGTVVGPGSNLFGGAMPPTWVPPFSWGSGDDLVEYRLDKFLEVAEAAMGRRDVPLDEGTRALLARAWESTADQRGPR